MIALVYALNRRALALFLPSSGTAIDMAPLIMLVISLWVVRVPFAFSMLDRWHADAIWWSFPIASVI